MYSYLRRDQCDTISKSIVWRSVTSYQLQYFLPLAILAHYQAQYQLGCQMSSETWPENLVPVAVVNIQFGPVGSVILEHFHASCLSPENFVLYVN